MSIVLLSAVGSYYAVTSPQLNKTMLFNLLHVWSLKLMRTKLRGPIQSCKFAPWRFRFRFKVAGPKLKFLDDCKFFWNTFCLQTLLLKFKLLGPEFQLRLLLSVSLPLLEPYLPLLGWREIDSTGFRRLATSGNKASPISVADGLQLVSDGLRCRIVDCEAPLSAQKLLVFLTIEVATIVFNPLECRRCPSCYVPWSAFRSDLALDGFHIYGVMLHDVTMQPWLYVFWCWRNRLCDFRQNINN